MAQTLKRIAYYAGSTLKTAFLKSTWRTASPHLAVSDFRKIKGIVFEVTNACNSRCLSCNIWQTKPNRDLITSDEVGRLFSDDLLSEVEAVIITGGEPCLRKDLEDIIASIHAARPQVQISLSTNGLLPDRVLDIVKFCISRHIPLIVGISLDAVGEKHDQLRGVEGNYHKVDYLVGELNRLKSNGSCLLEIVVGQTFSPLTAMYAQDVMQYAQKKGVHYLPQLYEEFSYYAHFPKNADASGTPDFRTSAPQQDNSEAFHDYTNDPLEIIQKALPPSFQKEVMLQALKTGLPVMHCTTWRRNFCASMSSFFLLRSNGDVSPCLKWSHISAGNVRSMPFSELWLSPQAAAARQTVHSCTGCSNTWATKWSVEYWFLSFTKLLLKTFLSKMKQS